MPKILVADDNSNIQKMVGLALKDQGIDVVAVGNGEAAVRKISDVRPDLVLADVFMPVRNGYEVCQYVKTDSGLSHIPVILLVGAFDPLDEQEAQRVGADGVLKKPFIPPDPLISMVKSALQRAGVGHDTPATGKAPDVEAPRVPDMLTPVGAGMPKGGAIPAPPLPESSVAPIEAQSFVDEVPAPPPPVRIDSGSQPVAFGSLLESPTQEAAEEESFVSQAPPPEFAMERDWHAKDEEETAEEEEEEPAAWRPDGQDQEAEAPAAKSTKSKSSSSNWRAGGFEQIAASKSRNTWEPEEETPELVTTAPAASNRVETPTPSPVVQEATPASSKPFITEAWPSTASTASSEMGSAKTAAVVEERAPSTNPEPPATDQKQAETRGAWFSVSSSPWDAEIKKANELASAWDAPAESNKTVAPPTAEKLMEVVSQETKSVIEEAAVPPAAMEAIREETAQVTEDTRRPTAPEVSGGAGFVAQNEATEAPKPTATPDTDDLVARVLAKMSPEVLQAVTREILKPVVEAMVKDELKSKKP